MLALVVLAPLLVSDVPSPRDHGGWVADTADVIDAATEARLEDTIGTFQGKTRVEIAVVTVGDVTGEPHAWGTELFNRWGIGKAASNNGVLLLLVMGQRDVEIITGDGIRAAIPDDWVRDMEGDAMVPAFKMGSFGEGLESAVVAIIDHLSTTGETATPPEAPAATTDVAPQPQPAVVTPSRSGGGGGSPMPWVLGGGALLLGGLGTGLGLSRYRKKQRTCATCNVMMLQLDEIADDAHLDAGERKEEALGSIDYEVRVCPGCQDTRTFSHSRWFSRYGRCVQCSYKTARSRSETIVAATYDHGGQVRVTSTCENCNHVEQTTRYTAARTRPSTSTSSFGSSSHSSHSSSHSSFGGGHSSGGGAGSHW